MNIRLFGLAGAALFITFSAAAQKIAVTQGQKLETVNSSKMNMSVEMMGQSIETTTETTATSQVEIKEANTPGFVFGNTTKRMVMHMTAMGQDMNFDSDKPEDMDGQIGQGLKGTIGKTQDIRVDKQGRILDMGGDSTSAAGGGMNEMMNVTGGMLKGQPYPVLVPQPGHKIKTGDSWTDSTGTPATVKMVLTYTVKDMNKDTLVLSFTGTMAKKGIIEQQGMQIDMDMAGTMTGQSTYETATGLLKNTTTTADVKGTVGIMGQSAPMTMTVTSSLAAKKL